MQHATKIATCNYCGTRAALVLRGKSRHELSCSGCGAPLHELKAMPMRRDPGDRRDRHPEFGLAKPQKYKKPKKQKKKSKFRGFLGEAFDVIEDIFD